MKILYCLIDGSRTGGMERSVCCKANYFADVLNYDVTIITTDQGNRDFFFDLSSKVEHIDLGINYSELSFQSLLKSVYNQYKKRRKHYSLLKNELENIKPDVCVSTCTHEFTILTKILDGSLKIAEFHFSKPYKELEVEMSSMSFLSKKRAVLGEINKHRYIQEYDSFIVLTDEDAVRWSADYDNVEVIPNILPFYPETKSDCVNKRVISVGRLTNQKGFSYLLEAWKIVSSKYPEWILDIYGDGELYDKLKTQIVQLKLQKSIYIHTSVSQIKNVYLQSSIYVMTSVYEGFGLSLVEAMSCGLPSVVFDCPSGPAEILTDGKDGFVVPLKDINSLANKIELLISDRQLRLRMGEEARKSAEKYLPEKIMNQWVQLFKRKIKK